MNDDEKWQAEHDLKKAELELKQRECALKTEAARDGKSVFLHPPVLVLVGAIVGAATTLWTARWTGQNNAEVNALRRLEILKTCIPHLVSSNPVEVEYSLKLVYASGETNLAKEYAAIAGTAGVKASVEFAKREAATSVLEARTQSDPLWSNNNPACLATWSLLTRAFLGQIDVPFAEAGSMKVRDLTFFKRNTTISGQVLEAKTIADTMVKMMTSTLAAEYEPSRDYSTAVESLSQILQNGTNSLSTLAVAVDKQFRFKIEVHAE